jgi:hypothetical protein
MAGTTTYYGISYPTNTDYVKDGAAAIQTVATGFDSAVAIPTYNAQTGTTYTFALTDVGKTVTASNAGSQTYTIPPTASVAWPSSTTLTVINLGVGTVTFAAGAGVTVTNTAQTLAQYQSANLVRTALNAWTVVPLGGIGAATGGAGTSFTPTFTNYTRGNGTSVAYYVTVNKLVYLYVLETFGTTSSISGGISMTLPLTAARTAAISSTKLTLTDTGTNFYQGNLLATSTTSVTLYIDGADTTYVAARAISSTAPFTWGNTDSFGFGLVYESA